MRGGAWFEQRFYFISSQPIFVFPCRHAQLCVVRLSTLGLTASIRLASAASLRLSCLAASFHVLHMHMCVRVCTYAVAAGTGRGGKFYFTYR